MFYRVEILNKHGPFHICWLADTYQTKFKRIVPVTIWKHKITDLCHDLLIVIKTESSIPDRRFSLRLSSQLMMGLLRLYQRQLTILFDEVWDLHMRVVRYRHEKITPKKPKRKSKSIPSDPVVEGGTVAIIGQAPPSLSQGEELMEEQRLAQHLMQEIQSHAVLNIGEITLREDPFLPKPVVTDGFGEEEDPTAFLNQPDIIRQLREDFVRLSGDQIIVMAQVHHEEIPPHLEEAQTVDVTHLKDVTMMEILPKTPDITMAVLEDVSARKSIAPEILKTTTKTSDIQVVSPPTTKSVARGKEGRKRVITDEEVELDPNITPPVPRKRKRLVKDVKKELDTVFMIDRIRNPHVDLRVENARDDIVNTQMLWTSLSFYLPYVLIKNLNIISKPCLADRLTKTFTRNLLSRSEPVRWKFHDQEREVMRAVGNEENSQNITAANFSIYQSSAQQTLVQNISAIAPIEGSPIPKFPHERSILAPPELTIPELDMTKEYLEKSGKDLNVIERLEKSSSGKKSKRRSQIELSTCLDEIRSDLAKNTTIENNVPEHSKNLEEIASVHQEITEKNIMVQIVPVAEDSERNGINTTKAMNGLGQETFVSEKSVRSKNGSRDSANETGLGSLDRTAVSLGEEILSTQQRCRRDYLTEEWGSNGIWKKIVDAKQNGCKKVNVEVLVSRENIPTDYVSKRCVAAAAFNTLLHLKKHQIIKISKDPDALTIANIKAGDVLKKVRK